MSLPDLICLSHLRWDFVFQRPQHLMSRFARDHRLFFIEEPVWHDAPPSLAISEVMPNLFRVVPQLTSGLPWDTIEPDQQRLIGQLIELAHIRDPLLWFYTPVALGWLPEVAPRAVIYDVMDELSLFRGAPPWLVEREAELLQKADILFAGGPSLYESKRARHANAHCFPSSVDREHFARARGDLPLPDDLAAIPEPRLGYFGVIDERMDLDLLAGLAAARPEWQIVLVGPVVKIDPAELPQAPNLHYLGMKPYEALPAYLCGWTVALMPFARNDATRFISPTKTPEYLAGGVPVLSTPIQDVVQLYGASGLVHIADNVPDMVTAVERAMAQRRDGEWLARVDALLSQNSWEQTWRGMRAAIARTLAAPEQTTSTHRAARTRVPLSDVMSERTVGRV